MECNDLLSLNIKSLFLGQTASSARFVNNQLRRNQMEDLLEEEVQRVLELLPNMLLLMRRLQLVTFLMKMLFLIMKI